jgi:hypothetical protein
MFGSDRKPTERLQTSRGHRQGQRTRRTKTLFEVSGQVRLKKRLTEPTLLEMSVTRLINQDLVTDLWYSFRQGSTRNEIKPKGSRT